MACCIRGESGEQKTTMGLDGGGAAAPDGQQGQDEENDRKFSVGSLRFAVNDFGG